MNDSLETYLHDHLAGANLAINLLESMLKKQLEEPLESSVAAILAEIIADRNALKVLADRVGVGTSTIKELAAWLGEKLSQAKLGAAASVSFELFEVFELVELGIRGKSQLWRALQLASTNDERLQGPNYAELMARAEVQYAAVESRRLSLVHLALGVG